MLAIVRTGTIYTRVPCPPPRPSAPPIPPQNSSPGRFLALFLLPVLGAAGALAYRGGPTHWSRWDRSVTSRLADAAAHPEARVLVMAGRTRGWKGAVAVHSWIVIKRENERAGAATTSPAGAVRCGSTGGRRTSGSANMARRSSTSRARRPQALIPRIEAAIKEYRYANYGDYRIWPGPNSNTFVATVLRAVPELEATLPPNAIGRDYRPWPYAGLTDSGTGVEANLWGVLGVKLGWVEGIEFNVLGLVAGLDLRHPARQAAGLRPHRVRGGRDGGAGEVITRLSSRPSVARAGTHAATYSDIRYSCEHGSRIAASRLPG